VQGRKQLGISLIPKTSYLGFLIGVGGMAWRARSARRESRAALKPTVATERTVTAVSGLLFSFAKTAGSGTLPGPSSARRATPRIVKKVVRRAELLKGCGAQDLLQGDPVEGMVLRI
jgi:hypothetical protein